MSLEKLPKPSLLILHDVASVCGEAKTIPLLRKGLREVCKQTQRHLGEAETQGGCCLCSQLVRVTSYLGHSKLDRNRNTFSEINLFESLN